MGMCGIELRLSNTVAFKVRHREISRRRPRFLLLQITHAALSHLLQIAKSCDKTRWRFYFLHRVCMLTNDAACRARPREVRGPRGAEGESRHERDFKERGSTDTET